MNNYIIKKVYNWADILDTALPYSVKKLQKINFVGKNNVFLIENGINIQKFSRKGRTASVEALKKSYPILGFMGSKPSFRGAKQALEVAKSIKSEYPNVAVLILGSDSELKKLLLEYKKYNFTIHAPGVVNYSHIEEYVRLMTIGFSFYESDVVGEHGNASQKVRQYLACGKPVFSTHHNHEFVKDNSLGYIFNDEDHEFMAEKALVWIKKINEQGEMLEKYISDYAARNFSCSSTFAKRIHLYRDLLGNGHDTNR
ncbi:MAG: glycosyltransferase [Proteobacteria bacterium]|nr:glycosyltransferase [Pseudomonadota bacterium]